MARPIPLELPVPDPRIELYERLQKAPVEHAEAMLAAYEVLQGLHDRGVLELLRGALGSGDKVLEVAVGAVKSPESIRTIRNLLLLVNMLGEIDPEFLKTITRVVPTALQTMIEHPEKPGMWSLINDFLWNKNFRRGLASVNVLLEAFGKSCSCKNEKGDAHASSSMGR